MLIGGMSLAVTTKGPNYSVVKQTTCTEERFQRL